MNRRFRPQLVALALLGTLLFVPALAQAQHHSGSNGPTAGEKALARHLFGQGVQAANDGNWEDARDAFQRAYDLVHSPGLLFNLTEAQARTGELVEAAENLRNFLRQATTGAAAARRDDAQHQLDQLQARMPHIQLSVSGFSHGDTLEMDGAHLSAAVLNAPLPVDPGHHRIRVVRGGHGVGEMEFSVNERESRDLTMRVVPRRVPTPTQTAHGDVSSWGSGGTSGQSSVGSGGGVAGGSIVAGGDEGGGGGGGDGSHDGGGSVFASPWFWLGVVAVVAIAGGTVIFLMTRPNETPFAGSLDTVHFQ